MFYCDLQIEFDTVSLYRVYCKLNTLLSFYYYNTLDNLLYSSTLMIVLLEYISIVNQYQCLCHKFQYRLNICTFCISRI